MSPHAHGSRDSGKTVAVVGTGSVGVAAAFAMFERRVASTILLVDKDERRARGEAADLMHAQALVGRVDVRAVGLAEVADAHTVVVTAGANQKRGETRLDLLRRNADVIRGIVRDLDRYAPDARVVIATNPVDVLTRIAIASSHRPRGRIFGSGTTLDSARLRALLGETYGVSPKAVHAHVLGEHGDSQFVNWSTARVGGVPLANVPRGPTFDETFRAGIAKSVRTAAYAIIEAKGYTNLAIGVVLASLVEAMLRDERSVHPLSVPLPASLGGPEVCAALPCVLGADGVTAVLPPDLDAAEIDAMRASAKVLETSHAGLGGAPAS